jgi:hypothetical protein
MALVLIPSQPPAVSAVGPDPSARLVAVEGEVG